MSTRTPEVKEDIEATDSRKRSREEDVVENPTREKKLRAVDGESKTDGQGADPSEAVDKKSTAPDNNEEEVYYDEFGRAVPKNIRDSSSESEDDDFRRGRRSKGDPQKRRGRRGASKSRSHSRGRRGSSQRARRSASTSPPPYKRRRYEDSRKGGQQRRNTDRGSGEGSWNGSSAPSKKRLNNFEGPMLSYREYLMLQEDDSISPEKAVENYNVYKREYTQKWELRFFSEHFEEEWFQDLYLPTRLAHLQNDYKETALSRYKTFESRCQATPDIPNFKISMDSEQKSAKPQDSAAKFYNNCLIVKFVPVSCAKADLEKAFS
eukprot:19445-Amorphochlora_amoeboformis.AAC.2